MVTAILMKWKREKELEEILKGLKKVKEINEILVFDNTKINLCGYWRYFGALNAKNSIIYVQDDDVYVNNVSKIIKKYVELKKRGQEQIVNNITATGKARYDTYGQTLVGWGACYPKGSIGILNKYIQVYGIDDLLLRDISRIYTGLIGKWHNIVVEEGKEIKSYPSSKSPDSALCMQDIHAKNTQESIKRIKYLKGLK